MIVVDRENFLSWVNGYLLERNAKGEVLVGDNPLHQEAETAMMNGETIALTVNGRIVTNMKLTGSEDGEGAFEEFEV